MTEPNAEYDCPNCTRQFHADQSALPTPRLSCPYCGYEEVRFKGFLTYQEAADD